MDLKPSYSRILRTCRRRSGRVRPRSVNALRPAGPPVLGCSEDGLAGDWTPSARAVRPWGSERIRIGCRVAVARGCVGFHSRALPVRVRPVAATEPAARLAHLHGIRPRAINHDESIMAVAGEAVLQLHYQTANRCRFNSPVRSGPAAARDCLHPFPCFGEGRRTERG